MNNANPDNPGNSPSAVGVASTRTRRGLCKHGHKHRHHRRLQGNPSAMTTATACASAAAVVGVAAAAAAPAFALVQNSPHQLFHPQSEASSSRATALTDPYQVQHAKMLAEGAMLVNLPPDHSLLPKEEAKQQKGRRCYFEMFMDRPDPVIPGITILEATNLGLQEIGKPFRLQRRSPSPPPQQQSFIQPGPSQLFAQISPPLQAAPSAMAASVSWPEPSYPQPPYFAAHPSIPSSSAFVMEGNPSGSFHLPSSSNAFAMEPSSAPSRLPSSSAFAIEETPSGPPEAEDFPALGDEWDLINFDGDSGDRIPDEQSPVVAVAAQISGEAPVDEDSQMALVEQFVRDGENDQNDQNFNEHGLNDHHFDDQFFEGQNFDNQDMEDQDSEYGFGIAMGGSMGQ